MAKNLLITEKPSVAVEFAKVLQCGGNRKDGYIECTGYKDILDAIYKITPEEIKILAAYTAKIQSEYEITFSFGNVTCPHCGNVTEDMEVNMDDLVFQTYSRLMNTEVDLKNIPDL